MQQHGKSSAVWVLALAVFAVGTGEFVLAGLIPEFADEFAVSIGEAGQIVTVFAVTCAIAGPLATAATARWPRRRVLLAAGALYIVGSVVTAVSPGFDVVLLGQFAAAFGTGVLVPNAVVSAARLVPAERRGRAIATVVSGFTIAVAVGAPAGTVVGAELGWRVTLWIAAGVAAIGLVGIAALVPPLPAEVVPGSDRRGFFRSLADMGGPLARPRVIALLATTLVAFTAVYIPYTYVSVIFEPATGGDGVLLSLVMLVFGVAGLGGNLLGGRLIDRYGGAIVVMVALAVLAASLAAMVIARDDLVWSIVVSAVYGASAFAITAPQQHRVLGADPSHAAVLISLNQSVLYLAIAASGVVGAVGIDVIGASNTLWLAVAISLGAMVTSFAAGGRRPSLRRGPLPLGSERR